MDIDVNLTTPWFLLITGFAAALLTRGLGVLLSGKVEPATPIFEWFTCVGQALVGGLMVRAIFLPSTALIGVSLTARFVAVIVGFGVFYLFDRSLLAGTFAGVTTLFLLHTLSLI